MRGGGPVRPVPVDPAVPLTRPAADFAVEPYPGARPDFCFVQSDVDEVQPLPPSDWTLHDTWPVLAYGSNACPGKIAWLRAELGLPGPVTVVRARVRGMAAVWAAGLRVVDDQRPATLAAVPGADETHAVWLATSEQLAVLDVCEGRGSRYDLARVLTGSVTLEDGTVLPDVLAYVAAADIRMPLLVSGDVVRCADVPQREARMLAGTPASGHGLEVEILGLEP